MLEVDALVGQQFTLDFAAILLHDSGFFKKAFQSVGTALGQGIGIGTYQHTAEKLLIRIRAVIELSDGTLDFYDINFIFLYCIFDLYIQFFQRGIGDVSGDVIYDIIATAEGHQKRHNQQNYAQTVFH